MKREWKLKRIFTLLPPNMDSDRVQGWILWSLTAPAFVCAIAFLCRYREAYDALWYAAYSPHAGELLLNRCRAIPKIGGFRICKMRDDIHHAHARNGRELVVDGIHFHRQKPQPIHAGIHLDVAAHVLHARLSEKVNLPEGMNDGLDLERLEPLNV